MIMNIRQGFFLVLVIGVLLSGCGLNQAYSAETLLNDDKTEVGDSSAVNAHSQAKVFIKKHYLYTIMTDEKYRNSDVDVFEDLVTGNLLYFNQGGYADPIAILTPSPDQFERLKKYGYRLVTQPDPKKQK